MPGATTGRPPLLLSLTADDELHLMHALIGYRQLCRQQRQQCPPMVDRVVEQVSRRAVTGQESSSLAPSLQAAEAEPVSQVMSFPEAARALGCSLSTVKRRVRDGVFDVVRNGRRVHLRRADIETFVESGGEATW